MNGCCMTNADSSGHDITCYSYWPCGCPKKHGSHSGATIPHTHHFAEPPKQVRNDPGEDLDYGVPDENPLVSKLKGMAKRRG